MKKTILILMLVVFAAMMLPAVSEAKLVTISFPSQTNYETGIDWTQSFGLYSGAQPGVTINGLDVTNVYLSGMSGSNHDIYIELSRGGSVVGGIEYWISSMDSWDFDGEWHNLNTLGVAWPEMDPTTYTVDGQPVSDLAKLSAVFLPDSAQVKSIFSNGQTDTQGGPFIIQLNDAEGGGEAPEPATIAGLLFAAAGVAVRRLRRK